MAGRARQTERQMSFMAVGNRLLRRRVFRGLSGTSCFTSGAAAAGCCALAFLATKKEARTE